ncbi:MAG: AEC family transporter [Opitutales bacterium]|nr:AEC family transporter [Opitutales bacterium]
MLELLPQFFWQLVVIAYTVVFPILLLAGFGFWLQKKFGLDSATLTRLNFYFLIPCVVYFVVVTADLRGGDVLLVVGFQAALMFILLGLSYLAAKIFRVPGDQQAALGMSTIFHNSGNYGLPLQDLAFRQSGASEPAMAIQAIYMVFQNFLNFTLGIFLAAMGKRGMASIRDWRSHLGPILRLPPMYALAAGLLTVQVRAQLSPEVVDQIFALGEPFWQVIAYVRDAFIALALCTLGAQLAKVSKEGLRYPVRLAVALRLLAGPVAGFLLIWALGIEGFMAQVLMLATCTPTAINCLLLCLEFDNHPDFTARSVYYSTLLSPITIAFVLFVTRSGIGPFG